MCTNADWETVNVLPRTGDWSERSVFIRFHVLVLGQPNKTELWVTEIGAPRQRAALFYLPNAAASNQRCEIAVCASVVDFLVGKYMRTTSRMGKAHIVYIEGVCITQLKYIAHVISSTHLMETAHKHIFQRRSLSHTMLLINFASFPPPRRLVCEPL